MAWLVVIFTDSEVVTIMVAQSIWVSITATHLLLLQGLHDAFDSWLSGCEAVLAQPLKTQGDPVDIMKQLKEMKVEIRRVW